MINAKLRRQPINAESDHCGGGGYTDKGPADLD